MEAIGRDKMGELMSFLSQYAGLLLEYPAIIMTNLDRVVKRTL